MHVCAHACSYGAKNWKDFILFCFLAELVIFPTANPFWRNEYAYQAPISFKTEQNNLFVFVKSKTFRSKRTNPNNLWRWTKSTAFTSWNHDSDYAATISWTFYRIYKDVGKYNLLIKVKLFMKNYCLILSTNLAWSGSTVTKQQLIFLSYC